MFVNGPPKQHKQLPYFTCTTSKAWPVIDSIFGGIYGLAAISAFAARGSSNDSTASGAAAGGLAALFIASAISGYYDTSECREATEALQLRLMRMYPGPGVAPTPYSPPPINDPWLHPTNQSFGAPAATPAAPEGGRVPGPETPKDER
jgi:hypothetical protein